MTIAQFALATTDASKAGVNRLSIGAQARQTRLLRLVCRRRPGIEPMWRPELSQRRGYRAVRGEPRGGEARDRDAKASAEVFGCGMHGEVMDGRPQVELAAGGMALEAAVTMRRQIDPEVAALGSGRIGVQGKGRGANGRCGDWERSPRASRLARSKPAIAAWRSRWLAWPENPAVKTGQRRGSGNQPLVFRGGFGGS